MSGTPVRPNSPTALVCIAGAPAVGKSAVADMVAQETGGAVFRIRSFAHTCRSLGWLGDVDNIIGDPHEWERSQEAVEGLLREAFVHGRWSAPDRVVILDDFPRTAEELQLLCAIARLVDIPLGIVELTTTDLVLMSRCHHRRVCLACAPDPGGEPHVPAESSPGLPVDCAVCRGPLAVRRSDEPSAFLDRVDQYRKRRTSMREAAAALGVRVAEVDATEDVSVVCAAVRAVSADIVNGAIDSATRADQ